MSTRHKREREEDRGWIGEPGYHWFYLQGHCICVSVVNAWGQGKVWKHLRHYLWMTADTTLGENETLNTDKVCVYWSGDGGMCVLRFCLFLYWSLLSVSVCLWRLRFCNLWMQGNTMMPDLRLFCLFQFLPGFGELLNISSALVVLGSPGQVWFLVLTSGSLRLPGKMKT